MPLTVITVKNAPASLRGDLSKWMQEIATGVYVGNFNTKIREELWERVKQNVNKGEATLSFAYRNEIGYRFETRNTQREVVDYDGIPLVLLPHSDTDTDNKLPEKGFSNAAKYRKAKKYSSIQNQKNILSGSYVVVDIETDGLDEKNNDIIEIGAVKYINGDLIEFNHLIKYEKELPKEISILTGITTELLNAEGRLLEKILDDFIDFIQDLPIVGYGIDFDMKFLNMALSRIKKSPLNNKTYDLLRFVKKEKMFLENYKLETALNGYEIYDKVPHRALLDARLIYQLSTKVIKFMDIVNKE